MKKKMAVILVAALFIFSAVMPVFAWTSFQNGNSVNNGLIDDGNNYTYPTTSPAVDVYTDLSRGPWAGIECAPIIKIEGTSNTPYAYFLHTSGNNAKVAKINLTDPDSVPEGWVQDGVTVNNAGGFQLSTPIIVGDTLYCAGNGFANVIRNDEFADYSSGTFTKWTAAPVTGITFSQSTITLTDNTTKEAAKAQATSTGTYTVNFEQTGFAIASNQATNLRIAGGLKFTDVSSVIVKVFINNAEIKAFVYNTTLSGAVDLVEDNGIYCWNENVSATSGNSSSMKIQIQFTTTSSNGSVELDYAKLYEQTACIGKIPNISSTISPATVQYVPIAGDIIGQINTPISSDGTYIFFGTYTTNGKYYRVRISDGNCTSFDMTGNSTYWAGAAICGSFLVFGTEDGVLYSLDKNAENLNASDSIVSHQTLSISSMIRSSICAINQGDEYKLYFTSRTNNNTGYLWCYTLDEDGYLSYSWNASIGYTNSTPVVSGGYVYVGGSNGLACFTTSGTKKWILSELDAASAQAQQPQEFASVRTVQASPVVYSVSNNGTTTDYVYVTTNQASGQCYCISYVQGASAPSLAWSTSVIQGTNGATYTLQGVAAGCGYLVYGNDYANVVILSVQGTN